MIELRSRQRISLQRICQEGLDREAVEDLVIRGEIEIACQVCDVLFALKHDGVNWEADEEERHGATELIARPSLLFIAADLPSLADEMKKSRADLEGAVNVDAGLRVRFALDLDAATQPSRMREMLGHIWEFSGSDLFLLMAEEAICDLETKVRGKPRERQALSTKKARRYFRENHDREIATDEALYQAVRRRRLVAYVGKYRNGGMRPILAEVHGTSRYRLVNGKRLNGEWVFMKKDLDEYASRRGLPEKNLEALIAHVESNRDESLRIRGPYGDALHWLSSSTSD